ncbi:hypothetical protein RUND412_008124 [Rhizina undulata]
MSSHVTVDRDYFEALVKQASQAQSFPPPPTTSNEGKLGTNEYEGIIDGLLERMAVLEDKNRACREEVRKCRGEVADMAMELRVVREEYHRLRTWLKDSGITAAPTGNLRMHPPGARPTRILASSFNTVIRPILETPPERAQFHPYITPDHSQSPPAAINRHLSPDNCTNPSLSPSSKFRSDSFINPVTPPNAQFRMLGGSLFRESQASTPHDQNLGPGHLKFQFSSGKELKQITSTWSNVPFEKTPAATGTPWANNSGSASAKYVSQPSGDIPRLQLQEHLKEFHGAPRTDPPIPVDSKQDTTRRVHQKPRKMRSREEKEKDYKKAFEAACQALSIKAQMPTQSLEAIASPSPIGIPVGGHASIGGRQNTPAMEGRVLGGADNDKYTVTAEQLSKALATVIAEDPYKAKQDPKEENNLNERDPIFTNPFETKEQNSVEKIQKGMKDKHFTSQFSPNAPSLTPGQQKSVLPNFSNANAGKQPSTFAAPGTSALKETLPAKQLPLAPKSSPDPQGPRTISAIPPKPSKIPTKTISLAPIPATIHPTQIIAQIPQCITSITLHPHLPTLLPRTANITFSNITSAIDFHDLVNSAGFTFPGYFFQRKAKAHYLPTPPPSPPSSPPTSSSIGEGGIVDENVGRETRWFRLHRFPIKIGADKLKSDIAKQPGGIVGGIEEGFEDARVYYRLEGENGGWVADVGMVDVESAVKTRRWMIEGSGMEGEYREVMWEWLWDDKHKSYAYAG